MRERKDARCRRTGLGNCVRTRSEERDLSFPQHSSPVQPDKKKGGGGRGTCSGRIRLLCNFRKGKARSRNSQKSNLIAQLDPFRRDFLIVTIVRCKNILGGVTSLLDAQAQTRAGQWTTAGCRRDRVPNKANTLVFHVGPGTACRAR